MTSSIDLDTKALEAAADAMAAALLSDMGLVPVEIAANVIQSYLSALPKPSEEVAGMVGWLQDAATHEDDKDQRTGLRRGAAMLEALSQSREADRVRARNEGIEMAAKCIEAKHAHNIGGVVHPIAQSDAAAIRALKDRL